MKNKLIVSEKMISERIFIIRGYKVIIDANLAGLYEVPTKRLNEQVKRNRNRFPEDFMFRLTLDEKKELVANCDHLSKLKFTKNLPYAFTEHGTVMVASILNSQKAIDVSIFIVRAFIRLRKILYGHTELARKIDSLEKKYGAHEKQIKMIFETIKQMLIPYSKPMRPIGFRKD